MRFLPFPARQHARSVLVRAARVLGGRRVAIA
jgi:hypothetical protein